MEKLLRGLLYFYVFTLPFFISFRIQPFGIGIDTYILIILFLLNLFLVMLNKSYFNKTLLISISIFTLFSFLIPLVITMFRYLPITEIVADFLKTFQFVIIFFIVKSIVKSPIQLYSLAKVYCTSGVIISIIGILQVLDIGLTREFINTYYLLNDIYLKVNYSYSNTTQATSLLTPQGNVFGSFMVSCLIMSMVLYLNSTKDKKWWLFVCIVSAAGLLSSVSYTSYISFLLIFSILGFKSLISNKVNSKIVSLIFTFLLAITVFIVVFSDLIINKALRYINGYIIGASGGVNDRLEMWNLALNLISENISTFLFGANQLMATTDNFYLDLIVKGGILNLIGLIQLYLVLIFLISRFSNKSNIDHYKIFSGICVLVFIQLLFSSVTASYFHYQPSTILLWLIAGGLSGLIINKEKNIGIK